VVDQRFCRGFSQKRARKRGVFVVSFWWNVWVNVVS